MQYALGIDIGGTNSVVGIVSKDGRVITTDSIKTQAYADVREYVNVLSHKMKDLVFGCGLRMEDMKGLGIGAPNANYYKGTIENAPNLPWKSMCVPLVEMFSESICLPVRMTNDANVAALGEMMYGVARGMRNFIMITLGTGVGSGIVVDGHLLYGNNGIAGELGHIIIKENGRECGCGRNGCLETYCSATGIIRTARQWLKERTESSLLREIAEEQLSSKHIYDAAQKGDILAEEVFQWTGTLLGKAFADFVLFSNPEAIVLFGGLAKAGEILLKPTREAMEENTMDMFKGKTKLLFSTLKDADAALLGAAALAFNE